MLVNVPKTFDSYLIHFQLYLLSIKGSVRLKSESKLRVVVE